jgi:protocatechuate 3,4-dioxygenase beta subunit
MLWCALSLASTVGVAQIHTEIRLESRSTGTGYSLCGSCTVPEEITPTVRLATESEPGERVVLSGTVYKSDGITPDSGITLFLYQTDAGGYYHRPEENVFHPRIFGWIRTGKDGRYEIQTVKPAPEILAPDEPAHIHVHLWGNGMEEHFLHEFWFSGDTRIRTAERRRLAALGTFSPVIQLKKGKDEISRGIRNIRIRPAPPWKYERD